MPGRSNEELERENKQIKHRPEDLKDTDVEDEYAQKGKSFSGDQAQAKRASGGGSGPSGDAKQVEAQQKQEKLRPDDLKDTDVEDEFKEQGGKGFRKNTGKARL